ncbi:MAG: Gfo/Idh/MocA family oxidoreductase [Motiliproteus sp.]
MTKLKIAVAGAGLIGRDHIKLVDANDRCDLVAIVDPTESARILAAELNTPYFCSLSDLFACDLPDGVILATPNHLHVQQTFECMDAGVSALVEKPIAHDLAEGVKLCAEVEASDAKILVGHHRAHSPIVSLAKELIRDNALGDLVAITGSATFYKPDDYFDASPWRTQPGGGPILINMIHEIGNLRQLCGEIVAVQAMTSSARRGFAVEDTAAISLRFENGALGTFLLSDTAGSARSWEQTSQENKSYSTYPDEDCYVIAGTDGSLAIPTMRLKRFSRKEDRSWWKPFECSSLSLERKDPLELQLEHFCSVIRGECEPLVSVRDGLQNLRITEAITNAAKTGSLIEIDRI